MPPFLRQEQAHFILSGTSLHGYTTLAFVFSLMRASRQTEEGQGTCTPARRASQTFVCRGLTGRVITRSFLHSPRTRKRGRGLEWKLTGLCAERMARWFSRAINNPCSTEAGHVVCCSSRGLSTKSRRKSSVLSRRRVGARSEWTGGEMEWSRAPAYICCFCFG